MRKQKLLKNIRFFKDSLVLFSSDFLKFFYKGWQACLLKSYIKSFIRSLAFYLNQFRIHLYARDMQHHSIRDHSMIRLQKISQGLHAILSKDSSFSYSVLMPVDQPKPYLFQESLESIFNQSAPNLEILVGFMRPLSKQIQEVLIHIQKKYSSRVRIFIVSEEKIDAINQLADQALGRFLMIMEETDWIRPDFFLRYEQTLRVFQDPDKIVLYCNFNTLNEKGYFIPHSEYRQPTALVFPFFFGFFVAKGLLIPSLLWKQIGGLSTLNRRAEHESLLLQLDLAGATFQQIPLCLYALRASNRKTEEKPSENLLRVLKNYSQAKNLDWVWSLDVQKDALRAMPALPHHHCIQIIIPYKDQKDLTLKCIRMCVRTAQYLF